MGIGKILKYLIEEKGTNVNELAEKVEVSPQTLYSIIKRDNMKADLDLLYKISDTLNVDMNVFYLEHKKMLTESEPEDKQTETQLVENFRKLSAEGQEKVLDYVADLLFSGRYKKHDEHQLDSKKEA